MDWAMTTGSDPIPTPMETRVLAAVVEHGTTKGAAKALRISRHTVNTHLDNLRDKTKLRYLPQLVAWAVRGGWLEKEVPRLPKREPESRTRT
jgi:DNA-binding CsgD family transcriptional regulator